MSLQEWKVKVNLCIEDDVCDYYESKVGVQFFFRDYS